MSYKVIWSQRAQKDLAKLDSNVRNRIVAKVESIKGQPLDYIKHLTGVPLYSLRVGDYRVILDISTSQILIFVVRTGHRSGIYDEL